MTEDKLRRAALIFALKERDYLATPENAAALAEQLDKMGLSGEFPKHFRLAFAVLREQGRISILVQRKDDYFQNLPLPRLEELVNLEAKTRKIIREVKK